MTTAFKLAWSRDELISAYGEPDIASRKNAWSDEYGKTLECIIDDALIIAPITSMAKLLRSILFLKSNKHFHVIRSLSSPYFSGQVVLVTGLPLEASGSESLLWPMPTWRDLLFCSTKNIAQLEKLSIHSAEEWCWTLLYSVDFKEQKQTIICSCTDYKRDFGRSLKCLVHCAADVGTAGGSYLQTGYKTVGGTLQIKLTAAFLLTHAMSSMLQATGPTELLLFHHWQPAWQSLSWLLTV